MIEVVSEEGLWTLTLNRPDKANALSRAMLAELEAAFVRAEAAGAKALILTGAGKVFSAGADLDEAKAGLAIDPVWDRLAQRIAAFAGLTICALNGTLAGGAIGLALACDLRLALAGAKIFYPVMRLGFLPQPADPARLVALVGPARAKMILMAGARVEAEEARDWGLIDRIIPADLQAPERLMAAARALCADVLAADASHVVAIKQMIG
jgi:enoyl-CoA hydratase